MIYIYTGERREASGAKGRAEGGERAAQEAGQAGQGEARAAGQAPGQGGQQPHQIMDLQSCRHSCHARFGRQTINYQKFSSLDIVFV